MNGGEDRIGTNRSIRRMRRKKKKSQEGEGKSCWSLGQKEVMDTAEMGGRNPTARRKRESQ